MATRLEAMRRVLKPAGSIYLTCEQTASHYLKILMDTIFGPSLFRKEIMRHYQAGTKGRSQFGRKHDVVLFYADKNSTFNRVCNSVVNPNRYKHTDKDERLYDVNGPGNIYYFDEGQTCDDVWTWIQEKEFQQLNSQSKERLGYPTKNHLLCYTESSRLVATKEMWFLIHFVVVAQLYTLQNN